MNQCNYCSLTFDTLINLGVHFVYVHFFNKAKNYCICPLCNFQTLNIINHVVQTHPKHCYYCTKKMTQFSPHAVCEIFVDNAMNEYVSLLFPNVPMCWSSQFK